MFLCFFAETERNIMSALGKSNAHTTSYLGQGI